MNPRITDEMRQALLDKHGEPVEVVDPQSNVIYYLVTGREFEMLSALVGKDDFALAQTYAAQDAVTDSAWSHPGDAEYDRLRHQA